nr:host cell division inhibitor Icd-like protein [Providencia rettgeri]
MIAYQESDSLLAGKGVSLIYSPTNTVALNYGITGNQSPKFTGNQSGEYFSGYKSADILRYSNLSHSKSGEFTPFIKGDFSHLSKVGKSRYLNSFISKNGKIEFCESIKGKIIEFLESIKKERIEFLQSIKKGSQSATLGNVDIEYRASENINISLLLWYGKYQPLGSMPRDCNSFLRTLLIHVAKVVSPSFFISVSNCSRNSDGSLIWYWSVFGLVFPVDIVITFPLLFACCNYKVILSLLQHKKTPSNDITSIERGLITNDSLIIEVTMSKHNTPVTGRTSLTPNQSYRWLFLALNRSDYTAKPCRIAVTALNEHDARLMLVRDYMLIFAGRLPAQEVAHA